MLLVACGDQHRPPPNPTDHHPVTGRFEVTIGANDADQHVSVHAAGRFDDVRRRYALTVDVGGVVAGWDGPMEIVQLPDVTYVRSPALQRHLSVSTPWVQINGPAGRELVDLRALLDQLVAIGSMRFDSGGERASASVRFIDVGAPVTIDAPSPSDVTDVTATMASLARRRAHTGG
jgi:hypothetical protein